jgi:hypothetical protein
MKQLSPQMFGKIEENILKTARPLEIAKWKLLFLNGEKSEMETELLKYQNEDGGFGSGLEIDTVTPESSALCASEAIKLAQDYDLDMSAEWVKKLLSWLENSALDSPSFWDLVPPSLENYPHMPYLKYRPDTVFTPHVCAIFVPALVLYGTVSQACLGEEILRRCEEFIKTNQQSWHFEIMFLQRMYLSLEAENYPFNETLFLDYITKKVNENICDDESKWLKFVAKPLDLIQSPQHPWYSGHECAVEKNIEYLLDTLREDGTWRYQDSWDTSTEPLRKISSNWAGYHAVKRMYLLKTFGAIS